MMQGFLKKEALFLYLRLSRNKRNTFIMYELKSEKQEGKRLVRTYVNSKTGTQAKTYLIYTDRQGAKWWAFTDLFSIPYIRTVYAKHINDMFTMGLTLADILGWCNEERALLKSEDPDKYEKLYALVLEKEKLAKHTADPLRQHLALATVYVLSDEESVDVFNDETAEEKMKFWEADPSATAFFLSWLTDSIQRFTKDLVKVSKTVSKFQNSK